MSDTDKNLKNALLKAYAARANLFHGNLGKAKIRDIFGQIDKLDHAGIDWSDLGQLRITKAAFDIVVSRRITPHKVFAHPSVLSSNPRLVVYYRNLVAISQKGMSQLGLPTSRFEKLQPPQMPEKTAMELSRTFNDIVCAVIENSPNFQLSNSRDVVFAEIGTELQGTWANTIGKGAAKAVEDMIGNYIAIHERGRQDGSGKFILSNNWRILFGSEPDIRFVDPKEIDQIVIEIKGSLDKAGAQTRYGEAKKSFGKALAKNPRCHTVYLASCFTDSVIRQIEADGQVREMVNLTSVLYDGKERERFLNKLFYLVDTPR